MEPDDFCGAGVRFEEAADAPGDFPGEDGGADSLATAGGSDRAVPEGWPWPPPLSAWGDAAGSLCAAVLQRERSGQLLYEVESVRRFAGLRLSGVLNFRHLLETQGLGMGLFEEINTHLASLGHRLKTGTIVDASIIDAPSSTKNRRGERDPEMHQTKKGNQWYFGMKAHIGVDAESGLAHSLATTAANAADVTQACVLLHGDETEAWGDAGYQGVDKRTENRGCDVAWQEG